MPLAVNDIAWNPSDGRLYLAVSGSDQAYGNSIVAMDPKTGAIVATHASVNEPTRIVISNDGQFLYAGLLGSGAVERITLPNMTTDEHIPLGWNEDIASGALIPMDLATAPGASHTVAVASGTLDPSNSAASAAPTASPGKLSIFDDMLSRTNAGHQAAQAYDSIQWGSSTNALYAADGQDTGFALYDFAVDSNGLSSPVPYTQAFQGFFRRIHYDSSTGRIYSDEGSVVDPASGVRVGDFPGAYWHGVAVDGTLQKAWLISSTPFTGEPSDLTVSAFSLDTFAQIDSVTIPNGQGQVLQLIRWGSDGLAFCTDLGFVYVLSGPLVR
jgi:hypothetical protein